MQAHGMRLYLCLVMLAMAACGDGKSVATVPDISTSDISTDRGLLKLHENQCASCHSLGEGFDGDLFMSAAPPLDLLAKRARTASAKPDLRSHFAGDSAADVLSWLDSLDRQRDPGSSAEVGGGAIPRGEQLVKELGCGACHSSEQLDLSRQASHAQLTAYLAKPQRLGQDFAHVPLSGSEASSVAAYLLRSQQQEGARAAGFGYQCFELRIPNGDWPDVSSLKPKERGVVDQISNAVATRKQQYALLFEATLEVPETGEWMFATRSDDGSWLWIDGELVVDNAGMKPATRKEARVELAKGLHELKVAYTQGGGDADLKVLWAGPGVEEQELPGASATTSVMRLVPMAIADSPLDQAAVDRGRAAARAARCDACHEVREDAYHALPELKSARAWSQLADSVAGADSVCALPDARSVYDEIGALPEQPAASTQLRISLRQDGCLSCHSRDGEGGLSAEVRTQLREIEDIGEEGLLPPDLTSVGRRLRPEWLERVIKEGHKSREYVVMRMPAYGQVKASQYAEWFGEVDAAGLIDVEPAFSPDAVEHGRKLAGTSGRNCISCHVMSGHDSLGPQGMDLALQHQRLRPAWFRDWLLKPQELRKNTRMPALWLSGSEQDVKDVDAIRSWLSLGESAPLPKGIVLDKNSLVLEPIDRPILHGAFLKGVSARCLAVGTPGRAHYAFDLVKPELAWIWRGAFLDARGTWHGRAGQLVQPLGGDWQVVKDFEVEGDVAKRLLGQRRTSNGYPVLRVACGDARYEDEVVERLVEGGSELVRTIRCVAGTLVINFPITESYQALVAGEPAAQHTLVAGQSLEVVYQW